MKKLFSLLLVLATLFSVVSCTEFFFLPPGEDSVLDNGENTSPGNPSRPTGVPTNPDDVVVPDDSVDAGRAEDYAYTPYLPTNMPQVHIDTADGTNDFCESIIYFEQKWLSPDDIDGIEQLGPPVSYTDCEVSITNGGEFDTAEALPGQVKVRGNYTIIFPKQPFRLKFATKQNLLGMNDGKKFKSWVLLAEWKDTSMLYDATAYYLGNAILGSDGYYCTDYRFVEVYLNDEYWGMYLLAEQQQVSKNRVNIDEPVRVDPETGLEYEYTGTDTGYFFEYDGYYTYEANMKDASGNPIGDPTFNINYSNYTDVDKKTYGITLIGADGSVTTPDFCRGYTLKSDIYSTDQLNFIKNYVETAFQCIYRSTKGDLCVPVVSENGVTVTVQRDTPTNPTGPYYFKNEKAAIGSFVDLQSLVDVYILNEICCDYDLHWSSFYMTLDMSENGTKKLTFTAPWDFDTAFGSKNSSKYVNTNGSTKYSGLGACESGEGLYAATNRNPWFLLLSREDWFYEMVEDKWAEIVRYGILDNALEQIATVTTLYRTELNKNAERAWERKTPYQYPTQYVYHVGDPSSSKELIPEIGAFTTQKQASDRLAAWLRIRFNYLNREWGNGKDLY